MTETRFLLVTLKGKPVHEFESPEAASEWARKRKESANLYGRYCPSLTLLKRTTTVVEEILDYV